MSGYIWYSFGSDKTGPTLGKRLGFSAGKKTPRLSDYEVIVGWGCKPGTKYNPEQLAQDVAQGKLRLLNHPDAVQANRDKLGTLKRLSERGITVPGFLEFDPRKPRVAAENLFPAGLAKGQIGFPLMLLAQGNRGEPIFCYTLEDIAQALAGNTKREHPLCYARGYDHGDEYRIHVFRDRALFAQKKRLEDNPVDKTTKTLVERFRRSRKKREIRCTEEHEAVAKEMATLMAAELLQSTAHFRKSILMGWKFLDWSLELVPSEVTTLAIDALDALQLDMGAVSVSYVEGVPRILSATTAPALNEDQMEMYVEEIKGFEVGNEKSKISTATKPPRRETQASPELVAQIYRKLRGLSGEKAEQVLKSLEE